MRPYHIDETIESVDLLENKLLCAARAARLCHCHFGSSRFAGWSKPLAVICKAPIPDKRVDAVVQLAGWEIHEIFLIYCFSFRATEC